MSNKRREKKRSTAFKNKNSWAWVCIWFALYRFCSCLLCFYDTLLTSSFCLSQHSADRKITEGCEENQVITGREQGRRRQLWKKSQRQSILVGSQGFQDSLQVRSSFWEAVRSLKRCYHYLWAFSTQKAFVYFTLLPHRAANSLSALIFVVHFLHSAVMCILPLRLSVRFAQQVCEILFIHILTSVRKRSHVGSTDGATSAQQLISISFDLIWMGRLMGHS